MCSLKWGIAMRKLKYMEFSGKQWYTHQKARDACDAMSKHD